MPDFSIGSYKWIISPDNLLCGINIFYICYINYFSKKNMKAKIILLTLIALLAANNFLPAQTSSKKMLVVYFSHTGNTRNMAEQIQKATGADIFEIQPVKNYPEDYKTVEAQAKKEIDASYKPELKTKISNIESYDVIFVGSPNWWTTIAPPVATFLSSYNFSGKTIVPFITHDGSRMGRSVSDIKILCPKSTVLDGLPIKGIYVKDANAEIIQWLIDIKIIK